MFNVMLANAEDIKMVAKVGTDESLPFKVRQVYVKFVGLLLIVVFLNMFRTERVLKNKKKT